MKDGVVAALATAWPEGAQARTDDGATPLHLALSVTYKPPNLDTVRALLEVCPQAAAHVTNDGATPLHLACKSCTCDAAVVAALLAAHSPAARAKDGSGNFPLHIAVGAEDSNAVSIVRALLEAWPEGARTANDAGDLPLHVAAAKRGHVKVLAALLAEYPDAASMGNRDGHLPLHCAVGVVGGAYGLEPVVKQLLATYPDASHRTTLKLPNDRDGHLAALLSSARLPYDLERIRKEAAASATAEDDDRGAGSWGEEWPTPKQLHDTLSSIAHRSWARDPPHHRTQGKPSEESVLRLITTHTASVRHATNIGRGKIVTMHEHDAPLTTAVKAGVSVTIVNALIAACPEAPMVAETLPYGYLPLHEAARYEAEEGGRTRLGEGGTKGAPPMYVEDITPEKHAVHLIRALVAAKPEARVRRGSHCDFHTVTCTRD